MEDYNGIHPTKDAAPRKVDYEARDLILNKNIELTSEDDKQIEMLFYNLLSEQLYPSEAISQCVGKVVGEKYLIKNIEIFRKDLKNTDINFNAFNTQSEADFLKKSSLYDYKSTVPYVYDSSICQLVGNGDTHLEILRIVVEFKAI